MILKRSSEDENINFLIDFSVNWCYTEALAIGG